MAGIQVAVANSFLLQFLKNTIPTNAGTGNAQTVAWPAVVYIALFTGGSFATATQPAVLGTEVNVSGYARQPSTSWGGFTAPNGGQSSNTNLITFGAATVAYPGPVTSVALYDALTGGNLLYWGLFTGVAEAQTLNFTGNPTGGTIIVNFTPQGGAATPSLPIPAAAGPTYPTAAQMLEALEAAVGAGNVTVTGTGGSYTVTFAGNLLNGPQNLFTIGTNTLTPAGATIAVARSIAGIAGQRTINVGDTFTIPANSLTIQVLLS